ncbi:MAG TPA: hypothetical protein VNI57_15285 [Candidatus Saccharimonadales bacterium]|nr:hypothetical protein [Candidatus Saccharimonadales bacterium]
MFPGIYEFRWDAGHLIFLGAFYLVALLVASMVAAALLRSRRDVASGRADRIRWDEDFARTPAALKECRHALAGRVERRTCENGFDCRTCSGHKWLERLPEGGERPRLQAEAMRRVPWFRFEPDRFYHRGHTWVKPLEGGTVLVGLDELGVRLMGPPESVELPSPGERLRVNGTGWRMRGGGAEVRVLSPVDGVVVATGGPGADWYLEVRPDGGKLDDRHLLRGAEVAPWILRQIDALQAGVGRARHAATLADGGEPVKDFHRAVPADLRDELLGEIFLDS